MEMRTREECGMDSETCGWRVDEDEEEKGGDGDGDGDGSTGCGDRSASACADPGGSGRAISG